MRILEVGGRIFFLRFLLDSRRLLVGQTTGDSVGYSILSLADGGRFDLLLPPNSPGARAEGHVLHRAWYAVGCGPTAAFHPDGETCYLAWEGNLLAFRTRDGSPLPTPPDITAHQVVISPRGDQLLAANMMWGQKKLYALEDGPKGWRMLWQEQMGHRFGNVAGILPDGERFVAIDHQNGVSIRTVKKNEELACTRYPASYSYQPQLTADSRFLGVIGYSSWYLFDMDDLGKPRKITSTSSSGNYVSFAFHPGGKTFAMIHGGPTLLKIHDVQALKQVRTYRWRLGPLGAVAYSPDGVLGAVGSSDGRVLVWDCDE